MKYYLPLVLLTLISTSCIPARAVVEDIRRVDEKVEVELVASEIEPAIKEYARSISVKVATDNNNSGSGVIIGKQGDEYLIITNKHVVRDGTSFSIQTADGTNHQANIVPNPITSDDDIALLSFNSSNDYQAVQLNGTNTGREEKQIYAMGFSADTGEFIIESGKIEHISDRPFVEGYQIGYSSDVVSGMSGGAIFDRFGDLVGINGIGAFPILDTAYQYEDETTPAAAEIEQFRALSWGLSIHRLLTQLNPEIITAYNLPQPETVAELGKAELTGWLGDLETKAKQISVRIDSSSGANGSGVIVAKEGNTYTVLTANHVLCEKDGDTNECIEHEYKIIAPDSETYSLDVNTINAQPGVDLAVFKFTSNKTYQVAELANYPVQKDDAVFVAGYPKLDSSKPAQWQFSLGYGFEQEEGLLTVNINSNSQSTEGLSLADSQSSFADAYEMVYTTTTYGGMSGGAVLDKDGRVIGIHGLAEGETVLSSQSGQKQQKTIQLGYSLGVPIRTFVGLKDRLGINTALLIQENKPQTLNSDERNMLNDAILSAEISDSNTTADGWIERGNNLWRLRRYEEAEQAFDRAIALKPEFIHLAYYGKGLTLGSLKRFELAVASLERAAAKPNFAPAFEYKSIILQELNRFDRALIAIENAIKLQPTNANWYNEKVSILLQLKRFDEAERASNKAIALDSRSAFYLNRGVLYQNQEKIALALSDFEQAIDINPEYADAYNNRGSLYNRQGKIDLALSDYNRAIEIDPQHDRAYYNRGLFYNNQEKLALALSDYNQAIKIDPSFAAIYNNRGLLYYNQGKIDLALSDYNQAIQINPQSAVAYNNRGSLYNRQGKIDLALSDFNRAIKINPQLAEAYYNRGGSYNQQEKIDLALSDYSQAIDLNLQSPLAYINRGNLYRSKGKTDLALSDFNQAIEIDPQSSDAYSMRGLLYQNQGKTDLALSDFNQAIEIDPQFAQAYGNLGLMYAQTGDIETAILNLEKAQQLFTTQNNLAMAQIMTDALKLLQ